MNCILIETSAYNDLQAHVQRLLERVSVLQTLTTKSSSAHWLTTNDVCKALNITKRALQYYRSCGIIPYTAIGNKVVFREEDVRLLLEKNLIKTE
ncbi:MAG: helix-turn-helix domain-containing protein [Alistipes sp.]|nr:helix-turn-helix domain-containing protein [Alistipes sp.]